MTKARKALQSARVIHIAFLIAAILYVWVPQLVSVSQKEVPLTMVACLAVVAFSTMGIALFLRTRTVQPAAERLEENPDDGDAAKRWLQGSLFALASCETVILFGLALRMLGAGWSICGVFYAVGFLVLLALTPKLDLPE
jgi:hypothetical protein